MNPHLLPPTIRTFRDRRPLCHLYRVPGRINIIGEHTDYNDGFVLPGASEQHLVFAAEPSLSGDIRIRAGRYAETMTVPLEDPVIALGHWSRYVAAAVHTARAHELPLDGLEIVVDGNLPAGAGMSSSSALTCGVLAVMNDLFSWDLPAENLIWMAREAENRTGVRGGIMDQFTLFSALPAQALLLDCRSLETLPVTVPTDDPAWFIIDTGVHHELVDSPYNRRREACERISERVAAEKPGVRSLRDVETADLEALEGSADPADLEMARYVCAENQRVLDMVRSLEARQWEAAGRLLLQSHWGLRYQYRVSCPELDITVDALSSRPGIFGARMMGAGFGGSVIVLADRAAFPSAWEAVEPVVSRLGKFRPVWFRTGFARGIHRVTEEGLHP